MSYDWPYGTDDGALHFSVVGQARLPRASEALPYIFILRLLSPATDDDRDARNCTLSNLSIGIIIKY